jgi:hypothetical protein
MIELSTALGLTVFVSSLSVAAALYIVDRYERIDYSMPFGPAIPYTIAVLGAGIFVYADLGVIGVAQALAASIFLGAVVKYTKVLNEE